MEAVYFHLIKTRHGPLKFMDSTTESVLFVFDAWKHGSFKTAMEQNGALFSLGQKNRKPLRLPLSLRRRRRSAKRNQCLEFYLYSSYVARQSKRLVDFKLRLFNRLTRPSMSMRKSHAETTIEQESFSFLLNIHVVCQ